MDDVASNGTKAAAAAFQRQHARAATGALDDATIAALKTSAGV